MKPGTRLPYQRQYPLKQHQIKGIQPTTDGLLRAEVLIKTVSKFNTPILPNYQTQLPTITN